MPCLPHLPGPPFAVGLSLVGVLLTLGCPPGPSRTDAGGDGDGDAGTVDAGVDAGARGDLAAGAACLVANDLCGPGLICAELFELAGAACWPRCEVAGPCPALGGGEGDCRTVPDGASVCVRLSGNLGPCGDGAGAACLDDTQLCVFPPAARAGWCVTPCSPEDPSTCARAAPGSTDACGCGADLPDCSVEGLRLADPNAPGDPAAADGVCIGPTAPGDLCGLAEDGARQQCSPGQRCDAPDGGLGTCQPE